MQLKWHVFQWFCKMYNFQCQFMIHVYELNELELNAEKQRVQRDDTNFPRDGRDGLYHQDISASKSHKEVAVELKGPATHQWLSVLPAFFN